MVISSSLLALSIMYIPVIAKFMTPVRTCLLNSRLIYPIAYYTSSLKCLIGTSISICPKLISWTPNLPPSTNSLVNLPQLTWWCLQLSTWSSQKPWSHLYSFLSHSHPIYQQIPVALPPNRSRTAQYSSLLLPLSPLFKSTTLFPLNYCSNHLIHLPAPNLWLPYHNLFSTQPSRCFLNM